MAYTLEEINDIISKFQDIQGVRIVPMTYHPDMREILFDYRGVTFTLSNNSYKQMVNMYVNDNRLNTNKLDYYQEKAYEKLAENEKNMKVIAEKAFMTKLNIRYNQYVYAIGCIEAKKNAEVGIIKTFLGLSGTLKSDSYGSKKWYTVTHGPFEIELCTSAQDSSIIDCKFSFNNQRITDRLETAIDEYKNACKHWIL